MGCAAKAESQLRPGQYEALSLAVAPSGEITGYYNEVLGEGVVKQCSFFLTGKVTAPAVKVTSFTGETTSGSLKADGDGVMLSVAKGNELPGCGMVLVPEIAQGVSLERLFAANWVSLQRIASARAHFFSEPSEQRQLKSFVVRGDVVGVLSEKEGWLNVDYVRADGKRTTGWLRKADCENIKQ